MPTLSVISSQNTRQKRPKINRSKLEISRKVIDFEEIISLKKTRQSKREISFLLEVPNSSMQDWRRKQDLYQTEELAAFFSTPTGVATLQRIVMAAYRSIHFGCGGVGGLQQFLELSELNQFVASSEGALQNFFTRCEEHIIDFGDTQEKKWVKTMKQRKITAGLDELFRGRHPCLVAIELISGYILLEKFTADRKAETWTNELAPRLDVLNVELGQVVSDLCGGIRAAASDLGAHHTPELFHAQYDISKGTSAPLTAQKKEFEAHLEEAKINLEKTIKNHGQNSEKTKEALCAKNLRKYGLEQRSERCLKVKKAKKELGKIYHPIDLTTG